MEEKSIWKQYIQENKFPKLTENIKTNVLIIGGGITGILCAYELKKRKIDYVLVEKDIIGNATTKDTTAFVTIQHETLYQDLVKDNNYSKAKEYLDLNIKALDKYKDLSKKYNFDYQESSSCLYTNNNHQKILDEIKVLNKLNYDTKVIRNFPLENNFKLGISFSNQAIINPIKLINCLSQELKIYENTFIKKISFNNAYTEDNIKIDFDNVIITTHYPLINISGFYFPRLTQKRSYVCAIKYNKELEGTYCSIDEDGLYFRKYKEYLIIGGNDRDLKDDFKFEFIDKIKSLNIGEIEYLWSGQDCISIDGIPYIGRYDMFHNNYYVATGFNLWGFTWAMASSFILADMIELNKTYPLVNPRRFCVNKKLFINAKTFITSMVKFKTPRCKHMGCALKYNIKEKVWECPCHGSRYDNDGNVLDGPSIKTLK